MAINKNSTVAEITKALQAEGFDAPEGAGKAELLELLGSITGIDYTKMSAPSKRKAPSKAQRKTVKIFIPSGETSANQGDVFVGHNGKGYQLKRDVEIDVPEEVVEVLRNAKQSVGIQNDDGSLQYRQVMSYPFSVVG